MPMVYVEVNNEPNDVMEDSKDTSTQEICAKLVSNVVQTPPLTRYSFQKHKTTTQDDVEPQTKITITSSLSNVNVSELNPNLV
jgi:hypothetical protein